MAYGKIIKGIAGFYYVQTEDAQIYECKAKGIFRKENLKPLVGDNVEIEIINEQKKEGNVMTIIPRFNSLIRPAVANIDQALIIFAIKRPTPNLNLLDRFLIIMEKQEIPTIICFNKTDLADRAEMDYLKEAYGACGYHVVLASMKEKKGIDALRELLKGKTTTVAGPSGVGKSTFINGLLCCEKMETGAISEKIERGKHTTRHSQLLRIDENSFIMDTPGFSSLFIEEIERENLKDYYPEFGQYASKCRFAGCMHLQEPDCGVKSALEAGKISRVRYDNYIQLTTELEKKKRYERRKI